MPLTDPTATGTLTSYRDDPMWASVGITPITAQEVRDEQIKVRVETSRNAAIERRRV